MNLTLSLLPGTLAVCRLEPHAPLPAWALKGPLASITRTDEETSIVCAEENVPEGVLCERGFACLKVAGPLDFTLTGVLAALTPPLAQAGISAFAIATYDTDYVLVKQERLRDALAALGAAGHTVP